MNRVYSQEGGWGDGDCAWYVHQLDDGMVRLRRGLH